MPIADPRWSSSRWNNLIGGTAKRPRRHGGDGQRWWSGNLREEESFLSWCFLLIILVRKEGEGAKEWTPAFFLAEQHLLKSLFYAPPLFPRRKMVGFLRRKISHNLELIQGAISSCILPCILLGLKKYRARFCSTKRNRSRISNLFLMVFLMYFLGVCNRLIVCSVRSASTFVRIRSLEKKAISILM